MDLRIEKKLEHDKLVFVLEGRLNTVTSSEFEKYVDELNGNENVIIDMEKVDYISSAGLRVLLKMRKSFSNEGSLTLTHVGPSLLEVFEITGFLDILNIQKD